MIAGITLLVLYKRCHAEIFQIICPGNVIGLNTNYIRREEWEYFQSCIRQQKDAVAVAEEPAIDDVDATLAKYMAWLEEGKITQEEYDALKKKLLNL
ncbi:MAG: hypothetical protein IKV42_02055 [Burkholderiaceae bacterium]|nr:hypothetical protein [Burkholderiaceae bacterium]